MIAFATLEALIQVLRASWCIYTILEHLTRNLNKLNQLYKPICASTKNYNKHERKKM